MKMTNGIKRWVKDRDEAMLSLDKDKIVAYCKKYNVAIPENETVFWAGVHKAILCITSATFEQKQNSYEWLIEHGFSPSISKGD